MTEERESQERTEKEWENWFGGDKDRQRGISETGKRDRLSSAVGGVILIWLGICFIMVMNGPWEWGSVWSYFLGGIGVILVLEVVARSLLPEFRRPVASRLIFAVILIAVGFGSTLGIENWWPLVIVGIGVAILVGQLTRSRKP